MGQSWIVVNLQKRLTMGNWLTLEQCLFDGSADAIEKQLRIQDKPSASWAGDNIICVGEYSKFDLPENVSNDLLNSDLKLDKNKLYNVAFDWTPLNSEAESSPLPGDGGKKMVLRNITKKTYVREEVIEVKALDTIPGNIYEPAKAVGFGQAVLSRICWSTKRCGLHPNGEINKGIWAGDKFEIIPVDMIESDDDVSDEVSTEMDQIWGHKYGNRWIEWKKKGQKG